ncbi:MAG TPA: hypothetical protein VNT75_27160 [Symbiobacteriaceae bacterium]|nr:hypothetical protein [Symbiobacteriaceae bacterium]
MSRRRWAVGLLVLLLGGGAFWDGLYAPAQQLVATVGAGLLVVLAGGLVRVPLWELTAVAVFGVTAALSLQNPASAGTAAHGPVIVTGWLLAFWLGRRAAGEGWLERLFCWLWAALGPLMVFGGLLTLSYLPAHHSGRLASFLGYPIAVGMLGLLGLAGSLPLLAAERWWAPLLAFGNGVAVLLSGSRGVWAVAVVTGLFLLWRHRAAFRLYWWPLVAALAASLWIGPAVAARTPVPAVLAFLLTGLTVAGAGWFRRFAPGFAVVWSGVAAFAPGWPWLLGRATALPLSEGSSVERLTFLTDGLRLAQELPWGAGFKAWTALHLQAASYSYYSAEVHSAPLDLALAFGFPAGILFLVLLGSFLLRVVRVPCGGVPWRLAAFAGFGALGLHALVDWDLSYGLFALPLWLGFGLAAPGGDPGAGRRWPHAAAAALAGLAAAGAIVIGAGDVAATLADQALAAGRPEAAARHGALATAVTPWNDLAHAYLGRALSALGRREEALSEFRAAGQYGPREPWYAELEARELADLGRPAEAAAAYRRFVRFWPWHVPAYEAALGAHLDMAFRADVAGDARTAAEVAASAVAILDQLDRQKAKEPAGRPRRAMEIDTPVIRQARGTFSREN